MLSKAVGTKSISQIKNFYYDYKKQSGKYRVSSDKKGSRTDTSPKPSAADSSTKNLEENFEPKGNKTETPPQAPDLTSVPTEHQPDPTETASYPDRNRQEESPFNQLEETERGQSETESAVTAPSSMQRNELADNFSSDTAEYGGGNRELIQQLLNQQLQQQQHQQLGQQQLQLGQQPQSALQQLLSQQHHQREQQQQQQGGQLSLEEARRLLQHQSHSRHQQVLSNLLPWVTASQLLQAQSRLQQVQAAAALQQQEGTSLGSVSDITEGESFAYAKESFSSLVFF
jgi:hypothetical protein